MEFVNVAWFGILVWSLIFIIALVVEVLEPQLVSIWFAAGAFIALLIQTIFPTLFVIQILIFIVSTTIALILSRPLYLRFIKQKSTLTNAAGIIGRDIKILVPCDKLTPGKGLLGDVQWTILTEENERFKTNDIATIVALKGNKAIIKQKKVG
jgi:membrane protein implicated in regulation of membrane protease activity